MRQETKELIERSGRTLEVTLCYNIGGMNYFQGVCEKRGYYLSVTPVNIRKSEDGRTQSRSYTAFSGTKILLNEVKRQSEKEFARAKELAENEKEKLIKHVMEKNGIKE